MQKELDAILSKKLKETKDKFLPGSEYVKNYGYLIDKIGTRIDKLGTQAYPY